MWDGFEGLGRPVSPGRAERQLGDFQLRPFDFRTYTGGVPTLFIGTDGRLRSGWRYFISLIASLAMLFLAGFIALSVGHSFLKFEIINRPLSVILLLLLYWLLGHMLDRDPHPIATMGLGLDHRVLRQLIAGTLLGLVMVCIALGWIAAAGRLSLAWQWSSATWVPFLATTFVLLAGALSEELVFRGHPFQRLLEGTGPVIAVTIMAVLFGLIHWLNPHRTTIGIVNTALIGVVFAVAWLLTGSLWFCWALHFSWNFSLGVLFGLPVSGVNRFSVLGSGSAQGPEWLTGGSYGIEAGLSGTAAILLGLLIILLISRWLRPRNLSSRESADFARARDLGEPPARERA